MAKRTTGKRRGPADLTSFDFVSTGSSDADHNDPVDEKPQPESPREFKIPIILLGIGIVVLIIAVFALGGAKATLATLAFALTILFVQIPATILALYILSSVAEITYGNFWSAILKLAAIIIFVEGPTFAGTLLGYPILSRIVLLPIAWFLFSFLFELDFTETFYSILGMGFVSGAINWLIILLTGHLSSVPT